MIRKLLITCSMFILATGCASREQTTAQHAHEDEAVCAMPEIEGKVAAAPATQPAKPAKTFAKFGSEQKLSDAEAVPVSAVLASPDEYNGKYVRLTGVVTSVCPKKGCWMRVAADGAKPGDGNVFIKFPDPPEGMYIPLEAVGHEAVIEGTIKNGQMSQAAARHFKQDAGASAEEIEKVVGPQKQVMLAQPAVAIEGVKNPQG
ncbi:MAG: DUF4920 domain-containing protein [Anaerolineae bacterium]|nr:DUF4920 domain-containing protein [Phycisphaerae bacterium]